MNYFNINNALTTVRADYTDVVEHVRPESRPERYRRQNRDGFPAIVRKNRETAIFVTWGGGEILRLRIAVFDSLGTQYNAPPSIHAVELIL